MGKKRWAVLALCCVLLMSVAVLYAWSVFVIPLEGIYSWSRVETSGVFTLSMCSYCAGSLLSGFLSARLRPRTLLWCAGGALLPRVPSGGRLHPLFCGRGPGLWRVVRLRRGHGLQHPVGIRRPVVSRQAGIL